MTNHADPTRPDPEQRGMRHTEADTEETVLEPDGTEETRRTHTEDAFTTEAEDQELASEQDQPQQEG